MKHLLVALLVLFAAQPGRADSMQQVPGARIANAAEDFVRLTLPADAEDAIHCTATLPAQRVPAGTVQLIPHWNGPPLGGSGRVVVPVRIVVDNRPAGEVAVLVQVSRHNVERPGTIRQGDALTVQVETSGGSLHMTVPATALQAGKVGDNIRVEITDTRRTLTVRVIAAHQASFEP